MNRIMIPLIAGIPLELTLRQRKDEISLSVTV